jgi:hypothetical protein
MQRLNTTAVYILSVLGFLCCCFAVGWIPSLIALIIANGAIKKYNLNPDLYENVNSMKTARTVAIIALVLSGLIGLITLISWIYFISNPDFACEFFTNMVTEMENQGQSEQIIDIYREQRDNYCNQ